MRRVPDWMLTVAAVVFWVGMVWAWSVGTDGAMRFYILAIVMMGVALVWKTVLGISWLVNRAGRSR